MLVGFNSTYSVAQSFKKVLQLPNDFNEISGIQFIDETSFYAINDGGNASVLLKFDTVTKELTSLDIDGVINVDWEDITTDDEGNIFIADIGNNGNARINLSIYKVENPAKSSGTKLSSSKISFNYEDQTAFPPNQNQLKYDAEALVWYADSLYIFTKNRTAPYDGYCYLYVLPDSEGSYTARLKDSFYFGGSIKELEWITAADIKDSKLVLLSSNKCYVFSDINEGAFFDGDLVKYNLGALTQKESVSFSISSTKHIYVADEKLVGGPNLYHLNLESLKVKTNETPYNVSISNRCIKVKNCLGNCGITIYNLEGKKVAQNKFYKTIKVEAGMLQNGIYMVEIKNEEKSFVYKWHLVGR